MAAARKPTHSRIFLKADAAEGGPAWQDRRIAAREDVECEVTVWAEDRNERHIGVDWRFTTADTRNKVRHLYRQLETGDPIACPG